MITATSLERAAIRLYYAQWHDDAFFVPWNVLDDKYRAYYRDLALDMTVVHGEIPGTDECLCGGKSPCYLAWEIEQMEDMK